MSGIFGGQVKTLGQYGGPARLHVVCPTRQMTRRQLTEVM